MTYYTLEDCDRVLQKIANVAAGMPPEQDPNALGTIGADLGGGGGPQGAPGAGGAEGGMKVNKDQLYERLIQEKDNLSRLKVQLAASGQLPPDMMEDQQGPPLQQQMQEGMSQEMAAQQGQPQGGMEVQAALKKKLLGRLT